MNPMNMIESAPQPEVDFFEQSKSSSPNTRLEIIDNVQLYELKAWYGCKHNSRWYTAHNGTFLFILVKIDNWKAPSYNLPTKEFIIKSGETLHIPAGFAVGFKALDKQAFLECSIEKKYPENLDTYMYDKSRWYYETFM